MVARPGRACADETAIRIEYSAPSSCPAKEELGAQLEARTKRFRIATSDEPALTFVLTISETGGVPVGKLVIRAPSGAETTRDVEGDTCAEVVAALALVAALVIDPDALTSAVVATAPPPPPPKPRRAAPPATPPMRTVASSSPLRVGVGAALELVAGVTPDVMLGPALLAELRSRGPLEPGLRLGLRSSASSGSVPGGGNVSFRWSAASLDGCILRLGRVLSASPCLRFEGGALTGSASDVPRATDGTSAWLAFGGLARLEWTPLDWLVLELDAGLRFPMVRKRFFFQPDRTVYRPAAAGWLVALGGEVRFR